MAAMADPLIPRKGNAILLCHRCQHYTAFAGGIVHFLVDVAARKPNKGKPHGRLIFRQSRIRHLDEKP